MKSIFYLFSIFILTVTAVAQTQVESSAKTKKTNKTFVKIPVVVSDREGRRIAGLKKENFSVFQNGVRQDIASFNAEEEPITVALLLDTSGSTLEILDKIKDAARDFIELLNPDDQCMIASFDSKVNILISFTNEKQSLKNSLNKIKTADKDGSVVLSAIDQIAQNSFQRIKGRKAIVLLSDGKDYGSTITKNDLLNELNESDVSIYPIYYQSGPGFVKPVITENGTVTESKEQSQPKKTDKQPKPKKRKNVYSVLIPLPADTYTEEDAKEIDRAATTDAVETLKSVSDLTAGRLYMSDSAKLSSIFKQVAAELRQQYSLGIYVEDISGDNLMRNIRVKVDRPNAVVQTRSKLSIKEQ